MIMMSLMSLLGLGFIYNTEGLTAGIVAVRMHHARNNGGRWCMSRQALNGHHTEAGGWLGFSCRKPNVSRPPCMIAGGGGDEGDPEATTTVPRLKRERRRRKDAGPIISVEEEEKYAGASKPSTGQNRPQEAMSVDLEAASVAAASPGDDPSTVVTRLTQESTESLGGTKGTKIRVDASDDDIADKLANAASAASGAAGGAAFAVGDAAKSAIGAAMSALGQGERASGVDDDEALLASGRRRATTSQRSVDMEDLGADIERYRKRESGQRVDKGGVELFALGAKDLISTFITIDFFVVIAFMIWFIAGVVSSYGFSNSFLLDQFNDKWTPVVQPALGVLMGGTIAGGVVSKFGESSGDDDEKR
ncbi:unnamed protein product [Ascophyllum nodosum]